MSSVRNRLYESYVSKFKIHHVHRDERRIREYWSWCDYKFLPVLTTIDRTLPILELGCGPGYLLEYLQSKGFQSVQGIDISKEQIQVALSQGLRARVADALKFVSTKRELYAAIIAIDFIEHFSKDELFSLFPMIHKALRKDGILLLQTPNGQGLFPGQVIYGDLTHMTIFAQDSLSHILTLSGFHDIRFAETGPAPDTLEGKLRTVLWRLVRAVIRIVRQIEAKNSSRLWTESFICWCRK